MKLAAALCLGLLLGSPLLAQRHIGRDPLNAEETDKLRDTAQEPNERLKLYVVFARTRLANIQQVLADTKAKDRNKQLHDSLEDFAILCDEIGDNVETYSGQHYDIRKALKVVIEGATEFQGELRALSQKVNGPDAPPDVEQFKFVLQDAMESLNNYADDARHILQEQNTLAKDKKLKKEE